MNALLLLKVICFLASIILFLYFCLNFAKKRLALNSSENKNIRIMEKKVIDPKTSLTLFAVNDKKFVIASSNNAIAMLELSQNLDPSASKAYTKKTDTKNIKSVFSIPKPE